MFEAWGRFTYRRRRWVLGAAIALLVFMAAWGTGVFGVLESTGGFDVPGSDSQKAAAIAQRDLGRSDADVVVVYQARDVTAPAVRAAIAESLTRLPASTVAAARQQAASADHTTTYATIQLRGADDAARQDGYDAIKHRLTVPGVTTRVTGTVPTGEAINTQVKSDIGLSNVISFPVLLVLLMVILGGLVAATLPLVIGGVAILGAFTAVRILSYGTDVSTFVIDIVLFMGLGLAIDYSLIVVNRFREELRRSGDTETAVARTMATAGRTVLISATTVAVSLAGMLLFPELFLRSMGLGGMSVVVVDMLAALTVLPALLGVLGPRVDALRLPFRRRSGGEGRAWYRLAHSVMRRPVVYAAATVALLLALGLPFLHISWGGVDAKVLPTGAETRVAAETLDRAFAADATSPMQVVVTGRTLSPSALSAYAEDLKQAKGVTGAAVTGAKGPTARISLRYEGSPRSTQARDTAERVRQVTPPAGTRAYVGGATAEMADQLDNLGATFPWLALVVGGATFVLLFLAFGSVVLPIKAMVMNALSLSAMFGAMVWIFQDGHLSGLLDFTATGTIAPAMPILMLCMIFGLSMDYEVFLLSRVREQYDRTGDTTAALAEGLQRTGGVITSAALLLIVVVGAFSISGISFIKMVGVGMVVAIAVDATIVRALLVPATMRLLGRINWWAPGPLGRLYGRFGIRESDEVETDLETAPA